MAEGATELEQGGIVETDELPRTLPLVVELREGRAPPTIAAALIAWALTLAPSGLGRGATLLAGALCVGAVAAGVGGPLLARSRQRAGRHLGISLFAALATATWLSGAQAIHPLRLDPIRGVFGAMAWGVFALSWSERWSSSVDVVPIDSDPEGVPLLLPRAALPVLATLISALGVVLALVYLALAFGVRDADRALAAQAAALACAVAVVTAAGVVATARGKYRPPTGRRLNPPVVRALLLLVTTAIAGAVITALR
jgi:hypothetical protein